ncbi:MAG: aminotransferase class IV [Candidatus Omnitrophica bacterium]|nr:aminotransferase class IV [Candidatus Omnitrophota bacterium]
MKIFLNGNIENKEKATQLLEPGFLFGWGVFEPARIYNQKIPFLDKHIKRLEDSLQLIGIEKPDLDYQEIVKILLDQNCLTDAYLRITVYKQRKGTGVIIYVAPFEYYKEAAYKQGFKVIVSPHLRSKSSFNSKIKSISYLQNRISWLEAQKKGAQEALVLSSNSKLIGGTRSNVFFIKNNRLVTPSKESGAFSGITREIILEIAKNLDIKIEERIVEQNELENCQEAFITSALMEVMPIVSCCDKMIGKGIPGKLSLKILEEYRKLAK